MENIAIGGGPYSTRLPSASSTPISSPPSSSGSSSLTTGCPILLAAFLLVVRLGIDRVVVVAVSLTWIEVSESSIWDPSSIELDVNRVVVVVAVVSRLVVLAFVDEVVVVVVDVARCCCCCGLCFSDLINLLSLAR